MATPNLDLNQLKARLNRLGVEVRGGAAASFCIHPAAAIAPSGSPEHQVKTNVIIS